LLITKSFFSFFFSFKSPSFQQTTSEEQSLNSTDDIINNWKKGFGKRKAAL